MRTAVVVLCLAVSLLLLPGCANVTTHLTPVDPTVKDAFTGSDCVPMMLGILVGTADMSRAMMDTPTNFAKITRVRNTQIWDVQFLGFGARCVEVVGEYDAPTPKPRQPPAN